jgi:hypothetical protein
MFCFCESAKDNKLISASAVYASRALLADWFEDGGIETPDFILRGNAAGRDKEYLAKEANSVGKIVSGLIELIQVVDSAHSEKSQNSVESARSELIKLRASRLRSSRKNFDIFSALKALADDAGVEIPDGRTLRKYAEKQI